MKNHGTTLRPELSYLVSSFQSLLEQSSLRPSDPLPLKISSPLRNNFIFNLDLKHNQIEDQRKQLNDIMNELYTLRN